MADPANTGIYEIVNLVNGKRYVGSAVRFDRRWYEHQKFLRSGGHHSRHLQNAWRKYGADAFAFRALLVCEPSMLLFYEQRAFDALVPEYNVSPTAGSSLGVKFTEQTKAKIAAKALGRKRTRESIERGAAKRRGVKLRPEHIAHLIGNKFAVGVKHTEEWKRANSERHKGRKHPKSPEYRAKISAALKGIPHSPERRAKQAAGQRGLKRKPYKLDPAKAEWRRQRGIALAALHNGKKRSPETIEKLRIAATGVKKSEAAKAMISVHFKKMWAEQRDRMLAAQRKARAENPPQIDYSKSGPKISAALKGRKLSAETRQKMVLARLGKKRGPYKPRGSAESVTPA